MDEETDISTKPTAPGPEFAAAVQPSYVWTVFFDGGGLRPGWGVAFYVAMFYLLEYVFVRWAGSVDLGASGLWSMMLEEFGVFVAAAVPALVLARVENRPWGAYGLPGRLAFGKLFWVGAVWGFASITLAVGDDVWAASVSGGTFGDPRDAHCASSRRSGRSISCWWDCTRTFIFAVICSSRLPGGLVSGRRRFCYRGISAGSTA